MTDLMNPVVHRAGPSPRRTPDPKLTPGVISAWQAGLGIDTRRLEAPRRASFYDDVREPHTGAVLTPESDGVLQIAYYSHVLTLTTVFNALATPFRAERTRETIAADPTEHLVVATSASRGELILRQHGRDRPTGAGDLTLAATTVPFIAVTRGIRDISGLVVPIPILGRNRHLAERPRRPVDQHTPLARAAAGFVRRFAADVAAGGAPTASDSELAAVDLIGAALAELTVDDRYRLQDDRLFNQQATLDLIARRYRDPDFAPEQVAHELHLSRRHLYRMFEDQDQSVASLIADARVEAGREMIEASRHMSISDVAAAVGFRSPATFRNQFKARYGVSPLEYRDRLRG